MEKESYPIPIFLFLTLLSTGTLVFGVFQDGGAGISGQTVGITLVLLNHILVHYFAPYFVRNNLWNVGYTGAQLIFLGCITLVTKNPSLTIVLGIWLCGETLGIQGKPAVRFGLLILYALSTLGFLFLFHDSTTALDWAGAALPTMLFVLILTWMYTREMKARLEALELAEQLQRANQQISRYAGEVKELTQQQERQRIARDLHDTLAQGTAGIILQLETIVAYLKAGKITQGEEVAQNSMGQARQILQDARLVIDELRSDRGGNDKRESLDKVLQMIKEWYGNISHANNPPCEMNIDSKLEKLNPSDHQTLPPDSTVHIGKILAEAAQNAIVHGNPEMMSLELVKKDTGLVIRFSDNGRGFDSTKHAGPGHYGIRGMGERAGLIRSTWKLDSKPGGPTVVELEVPFGGSLG